MTKPTFSLPIYLDSRATKAGLDAEMNRVINVLYGLSDAAVAGLAAEAEASAISAENDAALSQAWAIAAADPGGPGTKSSRKWAEVAQAVAADSKVYASDGDLPSVTTSDNGTWARVLESGGVQAWLVVSGEWAFQAWLEWPRFNTVSDLIDSETNLVVGDYVTILDKGLVLEVTGSDDAAVWVNAGGTRFRYRNGGAVNGFLESHERVPLTGPVSVILGVVNGELIGGGAGGLYSSTDGEAWTLIQDPGFDVDSGAYRIHALENGEVLLNTSTELRASSGWSSDPSTATWSVSQTAAIYANGQARFHQGWSVTVEGQYVLAAEYGNPKPIAFRSYLSTDYGATFSEVFNLDDFFATDANSNAHLHGVCIDHYHDTTPRLWQITSDSGFVGWWYSDDLGTNWTKVPDANFPIGLTTDEHAIYTPIDVTEWGIVAGSDSVPNGTAVMPRDENYASNPKAYTACIFTDETGPATAWVAQDQVVFGEWVFTAFARSNGSPEVPGRIVATNAKTGTGWIVWEENTDGDRVTLRALDFYKGDLLARNSEDNNVLKIPLFQSSAPKEMDRSTGNATGGTVLGDRRAISIGSGSQALGASSTAVGSNAEATGFVSVAFGFSANATAATAVAIGPADPVDGPTEATEIGAVAVGSYARANGVKATCVGYGAISSAGSAVAIGAGASCETTNSVAIGSAASAPDTESLSIGRNTVSGNRSVSIGANSDASGFNAIAIGNAASATESNGVSLGASAVAGNRGISIGQSAISGTDAIALGRDADASPTGSVALGESATASNAFEVNIGQRYMQTIAFTTNRGTPPAGEVAEWWHDTGSGFEKRYRTPDGTVRRISTEAV